MIFQVGHLYRFEPFYFENGTSKDKFFLVIASAGDDVIMASLPTSKDHIPNIKPQNAGAYEYTDIGLNVYKFDANTKVTNKHTFERDTFIYGSGLNLYNTELLNSHKSNIIDLGKMYNHYFDAIINNLKKSKVIKKKYSKILNQE